MARYAITISLSAFLLFQVQPLIGKFILPWFGGGPGVWTSCMLFFQVTLLGGYSYAHLIASKLSGRAQMMTHVGLLAVSLLFLPITPDEVWKSSAGEDAPIGQILALLGITIGLPYFLLSSTGPLLQEGFRRETGHTPYRLYSLSNAGSLLALLSYPFVFEPQLKLQTQIYGWSIGYVLFALLCGWCALGFVRTSGALPAVAGLETDDPPASDRQPTWGDVLLWLALSGCGSSMLLATTNQVCLEVCSVPFLWVVPLSLYLLTFIICFDHERWYQRSAFLVLLVGGVIAAVFALMEGNELDLTFQLVIYCSVLWITCMACHGELVRAKPAPRYATWFYLIVAAGGALGGVLVGLVAPLVLHDFWEYQISLVASAVIVCVAAFREAINPATFPRLFWVGGGLVSVAIGLTGGWLLVTSFEPNPETGQATLETSRNFYGVLRINREDNFLTDNGPMLELVHGRIQHGFQYLDPDKRRMPTSYYGHPSGIGLAIDRHPRRSSDDPAERTLSIGVVGLGCGTLAAFGTPGDVICFYEINPQVDRISQEYFTYRNDSEAQVEVVLGDARIRMEQELAAERPRQFDVLAIDAFSSDAIPMHLLTLECVNLYLGHLKNDGLLCLHISNRYLDLNGVARGVAAAVGCECVRIDSKDNAELGLNFASWVILTKNKTFLETPEVHKAIKPWNEEDRPPIVWTDDYASLWQTLERSPQPR